MKRKASKYILFSVIIVVGVALDQITKVWAKANFKTGPGISYWNDFFRFAYAENEGAFLSMGANWDPVLRLVLLTIIPGIVLVGLMVYLLRSDKLTLLENIAFGLIAAGGIGNILDRILEGKVVDFMIMEVFGWHTGVFNVADLYIVFGIIIFILAYFAKARSEKKRLAAEAAVDSE